MKILTLGDGFVANHLPYPKYTKKLPPDELAFECRILDVYTPDVIVNCIGKTGKNETIDALEDDKISTYLTNVTLPSIMASECARKGIHLINISSGCIFQGQSPHKKNDEDLGWKETDFANPPSYYSKTKYACDLAIGDLPNVTSLRIRIPFSPSNTPRNLISKLRGYKKILNEPNSMTYMTDFVKLVDWIIDEKLSGIYNCTNPETLSPLDFANEIKKYDSSYDFEEISANELNNITLAKRSNCILDSTKLKNAGFEMMPAKEALVKCMKEYFNA